MRLSVAALVAGLVLSSSAAYAVDWSINSTLSQSLELNDNMFLKAHPEWAYGAYSNLSATVTGRTPTSRFDFTPTFNYQKYFGPGAQGQQMTDLRSESARAHYEHVGKLATDREYADLNFSRSSIAAVLLSEFGVSTPSTGNIDSTTGVIGLERNLTATDFLALSGRTTSVDYEPPSAGTHLLNSGASANFRHQSNRNIALTASSDFTWLTFANAVHTNIYLLQEMAGFDAKPVQGLTVTANAGAAIVSQRQDPTLASILAGTPSSSTTAGLVYNAVIGYQLPDQTQLTFRAVQSISPSTVGSLSQLTDYSLTLLHTINHFSSVSVTGDIGQQTTSGFQSNFWSASTSYSRQLAREWTFQATYRFFHRGASTAASSPIFDPITGVPTGVTGATSSPANSNSFLFVLTRSLVILPPGT